MTVQPTQQVSMAGYSAAGGVGASAMDYGYGDISGSVSGLGESSRSGGRAR